MKTITRKQRILAAIAVPIAVIVTAAAGFTAPAHASTNPVPYPAALANHPYSEGWTGAQLATDFQDNAANDPGNCSNPDTAGIYTSGDNVYLRSDGTDCLYLQSPHTYPTLDGYVYEEKINVTSWTPWSAFWGYGNNWPTDGEIDALEASPTGQNNVSYHYAGPSYVSTSNNTITDPANAQQLSEIAPGTHYVDFTFGRCGAGCGAVAVWYDGVNVALIKGSFVLDGGSNDDPYWIVAASTGQPEFGSCGNPCGTMAVSYLRIFT